MATESSVIQEGSCGSTSLSLLERAKEDDPSAWERLTSLYTPMVEEWCRKAGLRGSDVEDVTQEVFLAVVRNLAGFHRDQAGDTFRGWLYIITKRKLCDHRRSALTGPMGVGGSDAQEHLLQHPADESSDSEEAGDANEQKLLYRRALELARRDFGDQTWQAFWLVVMEEQAPKEVAVTLETTANAVSLAKARVLSRLREEFKGILND